MGSVNEINPKVDTTVRVFDDFYSFSVEVEANEYDVINSYFKSVFSDNQIARNFTTAFFRIADQTRQDPLTMLAEIEGQDTITLTNTMCYYLNGIRSPTTLLGVNNPVVPNYWAARNVLL